MKMDFSQESMQMIRLRIADELRKSCLNIQDGSSTTASIQASECKKTREKDHSTLKSKPFETLNDDMDDFQTTSLKYRKGRKRSREEPPKSVTKGDGSAHKVKTTSETEKPTGLQPQKWNDLCQELQDVLPPTDKYSYLLEAFQQLPKETFCGAPESSFEVKLCVNLENEEDTKEWVSTLMEQSKCTYRVTRSYHPKMKRVRYKLDLHCQHFKKKLTDKQVAKCTKQKEKTFVLDLRKKKTQCPSKLCITIQIPSKAQSKNGPAARVLHDHKGYVQLTFNHNHPLESAHVLSFRPISAETKEKNVSMFSMGHSAATARHFFETLFFEEDESEMQQKLADRSVNPNVGDVNRLYKKWRQEQMGEDDGKQLLERLQCEFEAYNEKWGKEGGRAALKLVEADLPDSDSESDTDEPTPPKSKR